MKKILVTGATGNIGSEVIRFLSAFSAKAEIIAAVRNIGKDRLKFPESPRLGFRNFDFENEVSFLPALRDIDTLFLLRPPQLADVDRYFKPLLEAAKAAGVKQIVFLSVQGAEMSRVIPHNKIERLIGALGFDHIFLRPGYFMQNLTTTLLAEIRQNQRITLPSGHAKFNWIDAKNIGEAAATVILYFDDYQGRAYDITGSENLDFYEVAEIMTRVIGTPFGFKSVNPFSYFIWKKKDGVSTGFAFVMTLLHFLPRIQKRPEISDHYFNLTGKPPTTLEAFLEREKHKFLPNP